MTVRLIIVRCGAGLLVVGALANAVSCGADDVVAPQGDDGSDAPALLDGPGLESLGIDDVHSEDAPEPVGYELAGFEDDTRDPTVLGCAMRFFDNGEPCGPEDEGILTEHELNALAEMNAFESSSAAYINNGILATGLFREIVGFAWSAPGQTVRCAAHQLSERYLLTAAHCLAPAGSYSATLNDVDFRFTDAAGTQVQTEQNVQVRIHPSWNVSCNCGTWEHDFALMLLERDAPWPFVRGRFHNSAAAPSGTFFIVGWRDPNGPENSQKKNYGYQTFSSWTATLGLKTSVTSSEQFGESGDSGGSRQKSTGSGRYPIIGVSAAANTSATYGPRVVFKMPWVFSTSSDLQRPLTCSNSTAGGIPYFYGCQD